MSSKLNLIIIITISVELVIILTLLLANIFRAKKIVQIKKTKGNIEKVKVIKNIIEVSGTPMQVTRKVEALNDILKEKLGYDYSTIIYSDGNTYNLVASNVEKDQRYMLDKLHNLEVFQTSITTNQPISLKGEKDSEVLPYLVDQKVRSVSCMFYPLTKDNVFLGYWLLESKNPHAFVQEDLSVLELLKNSIIDTMLLLSYEKSLEVLTRSDSNTKLPNAEYLFTTGREIIDKWDKCTFVMYTIENILEINQKASREVGTLALTKAIDDINKLFDEDEIILVRYLGPNFAIAIKDKDHHQIVSIMENVKAQLENPDKTELKQLEGQVPELKYEMEEYIRYTGIENTCKRLIEKLNEK